MRMMALAMVALTAGGSAAVAQEQPAPSPVELTLATAVAQALELNPNLAAVREDLPAARARLRMAHSQGQPVASANLSLSTGTMGMVLSGADDVMPKALTTAPGASRADANLTFMYPLYTGGRIGSSVSAARYKLRATQADIDAMVLEVAYQVRQAYWQVLLSREMLRVQEENLAAQEERLRVDQASLDAGKLPLYYVQRDKAELATAQQGLTNAQRDVATALLDLNVAIGLPPSTPLELADQLVYDPAAAEVDEKGLLASALESRPEAEALRASLEAAGREVRSRRAAYQPQIEGMLMFEGTKQSGMGADAGYLAGVIASLPILDGGSRRAGVWEARAMARRTEKELAVLNLEIERQLRAAVLDLRAANRNVRTATEAVAAAEEDNRVALARYRAGKAINLEAISALATLVQARTNLAQALFDYNVAVDAVKKAAGKLPPA